MTSSTNSNLTGLGCDIEEVRRFRARSFRSHTNFYHKIFTDKEIAYCLKYKDPYPHFAARFCAKEAVIKVLGKAVDFKNIEIINDSSTGAPRVIVKNCDFKISVSLSHMKEYAMAVACSF